MFIDITEYDRCLAEKYSKIFFVSFFLFYLKQQNINYFNIFFLAYYNLLDPFHQN